MFINKRLLKSFFNLLANDNGVYPPPRHFLYTAVHHEYTQSCTSSILSVDYCYFSHILKASYCK